MNIRNNIETTRVVNSKINLSILKSDCLIMMRSIHGYFYLAIVAMIQP